MGNIKSERFWLVGAGLVAFVLTLVGYFFFISPQRGQTDQVESDISSAQLDGAGLQGRISTLTAENAKASTYQRALQQAQLALPSTSGMPAFLRTLQSTANATSTGVTSLAVGQPEAVTATAGSAAAPAAPAPAASSSTTKPATPAAAAGTPTAAVYAIPITATVTGAKGQLMAFLTQLQSVQPRAVLITAIVQGTQTPTATTTSKAGGGTTSLQLTMSAFVAPPPAAATTATPAPTVAAGK